MGRTLMVMAVPVLALGCAGPDQRPGFSRAASREPEAVTAPAPRASRPTPSPESDRAAGTAPAERPALAPESSHAPSPPPPAGSAGKTDDQAVEHREATAEKQVFEGISGLVLDETMTRIGREFFEQFCLLWEAPTTGLSGYNVIISEKASPVWGVWIMVSVDDVPIWSKVLKPRSEEIEAEIEEARAIVYEYVSNYEQYQVQTEDMVGTGF